MELLLSILITSVLSYLLGLYSAIGGYDPFVKWITAFKDKRRLLKELNDSVSGDNDFKYKELTIGVRISKDGQWDTYRKGTVVSLQENLRRIPVTIELFDSTGEHYVKLDTAGLSLDSGDEEVQGKKKRWYVRPPKPLRKFEEQQFTFKYAFQKGTLIKEDSLFWGSTRKVDNLRLRVIFVDQRQRKVYARIRDIRENVREENRLYPDSFTKEYTWTFEPKENFEYHLVWVLEEQPQLAIKAN